MEFRNNGLNLYELTLPLYVLPCSFVQEMVGQTLIINSGSWRSLKSGRTKRLSLRIPSQIKYAQTRI